jgi:hypothetical protein
MPALTSVAAANQDKRQSLIIERSQWVSNDLSEL